MDWDAYTKKDIQIVYIESEGWKNNGSYYTI